MSEWHTITVNHQRQTDLCGRSTKKAPLRRIQVALHLRLRPECTRLETVKLRLTLCIKATERNGLCIAAL